MTDTLPAPVDVKVCSLCRLPWEDHVEHANREEQWKVRDAQAQGYEYVPVPQTVTALSCVHLLLLVNQGPTGPPGPIGPAGEPFRYA